MDMPWFEKKVWLRQKRKCWLSAAFGIHAIEALITTSLKNNGRLENQSLHHVGFCNGHFKILL
jgi:hypothetical protein